MHRIPADNSLVTGHDAKLNMLCTSDMGMSKFKEAII